MYAFIKNQILHGNLSKYQTDYSEFLCGHPHMGHANVIVLLNEFPVLSFSFQTCQWKRHETHNYTIS